MTRVNLQKVILEIWTQDRCRGAKPDLAELPGDEWELRLVGPEPWRKTTTGRVPSVTLHKSCRPSELAEEFDVFVCRLLGRHFDPIAAHPVVEAPDQLAYLMGG